MKYTLLEMVQDILSSMDSDEVNSIHDTPESAQVVKVIKTVYDDLISRSDLTSNKLLFNLVASNNQLEPTVMYKPENIDRFEWIKYNVKNNNLDSDDWRELRYLPIHDFIDHTQTFNQEESNVKTIDFSEEGFVVRFNFLNDQPPTYYTTTNDNQVLFDSYDSNVDGTLQTSKTLGYGFKRTYFIENDTFVPELQPQQFALLLNEAKSLAWAELKQTSHAKAEQAARRNWRHIQKTRHNIPDGQFGSGTHPFEQLRNFGRKR